MSVEQSEGQSEWRKKAMTNCKERVLAESTNRELKVILAQQSKLFKAAEKVLSHCDTLEGMKFVSLPQPTTDRAFAQFDPRNPVFTELSDKACHLYLQTDCMLPPLSEDIAVSIRTQAEAHGMCLETEVSTPMACTTKEAQRIFWDHVISEGLKKFFLARFDQVISHDGSSCSMNIASTLFTRDDDTNEFIRIDSMSTIQRYQESNRTVVVGSTRWLAPSHGVQLEDVFWIVVAPSAVDPAHSSVIQSKYRLQVTNPGWRSLQPSKGTPKHEVVLNSVSTTLHNYHQVQQDNFLDKVNWLSTNR
ncbi:hypothetical protein PRNP1_013177 [Phytophthora ramorum]